MDDSIIDDLDRHHLANLKRLEIDPEPFICSNPERADRRRELATEAPGWPHTTRILKRGWVLPGGGGRGADAQPAVN